MTTTLHRYSNTILNLKDILERHKLIIVSIPKIDIKVIQDLSPRLYPAEYGKVVCEALNDFMESDLFASFSVFTPSLNSDKTVVKISFVEEETIEFGIENETVLEVIAALEEQLKPSCAAPTNYKTGNDIYIIQPNQNRFWTEEAGKEDGNDLINQILCNI